MVKHSPAVFLFAGGDSGSKEKALKKLASASLDSSSLELDYKVFDGSASVSRDILDCLTTIPFLASRRFVVIKNFEKLPEEDISRLMAYIEKPLRSTCLVIDSNDIHITRKYPGLARHAAVTTFPDVPDARFQSMIVEELRSCGDKRMDADAVRALKEACGAGLSQLSQELRKLSAYSGDRRDISVSDIEEVVSNNPSASTFDLTDAIENSDAARALSVISLLLLLGKKHFEIIGLLCWHTKKLLRARVLLDKGRARSEVVSLLKINRYHQDRFFAQVMRSDVPGIRNRMKHILDADMDIKMSRRDAALALELVVIKLCLGARGKPGRRTAS